MALIIEELNRGHRVHTRLRMESKRVTLGRGYNNAVIVEDPHVDAVHAEVCCDEHGHYVLRDLNSTNGTRLLGNRRDKSVMPAPLREHAIQSGDEVQIGKSCLRFTHSETEVAPAAPLHSLEILFDWLARPGIAIGLCLLITALSLWLTYLATVSDFGWAAGFKVIADVMVILLAYAGIWAFIGRVVRHEAHFLTHLSIAAAAALLFAGWRWFAELLSFNYSISRLEPLLTILALGVLLPAVLWCASFLALNLTPRWRWTTAVLLPWCFLALVATIELGDLTKFSENPRFSAELKSDRWRWRDPLPMEVFHARTPMLFDIPLKEKTNHDTSAKESNKTAGNKPQE